MTERSTCVAIYKEKNKGRLHA